MSIPGGLALSTAVSLGVTLILSAVVAKMVDAELMGEGAIGYGSLATLLTASISGAIGYGALITLLTSAIAGAAFAATKIKRQRMLVCFLSGLVYYITLLGITALFFGGQYQGMGITALVIAGGCGTVILMGMKQGKGKEIRHRKKLHR